MIMVTIFSQCVLVDVMMMVMVMIMMFVPLEIQFYPRLHCYHFVTVGAFCTIYLLPTVLVPGTPYLGKPSDMWALGVVLFTMLYGQFPFYDSVPQELFRKIKAADFKIPK